MQSLPDGCCDLIYLDPPFFSGKARTQKKNEFSDQWSGGLKSYLAFLYPRLQEAHRLLAEHGTIYLHLDYRVVHHARLHLDTIFGADNFLNEIIWCYRTGGLSKRWFARKHDTLLMYAKHRGKHSFNVLREGKYRTDGLNTDENGRPYKSTKKGRLYFNIDGPAMSDVWDVPFLSTVSLERVGWPTQKPLALLERVIRASTQPGDLVADFFCGSGTTLVAAKRLGRRWMGCDASKEAVAITRKRLLDTRKTNK